MARVADLSVLAQPRSLATEHVGPEGIGLVETLHQREEESQVLTLAGGPGRDVARGEILVRLVEEGKVVRRNTNPLSAYQLPGAPRKANYIYGVTIPAEDLRQVEADELNRLLAKNYQIEVGGVSAW